VRIDPKHNTLVCGDNLEWLKHVPDESVDLCYIDPPFFSNRNYEIIWGNGYETRSFGDRFAGGVSHYIEWMRPRISLIHRKLKRTGSLFLHCDWHASHRLRVLVEDVFGEEAFRNEIVWQRSTGKALMSRSLPANHDVIFRFTRGGEWTWNEEEVFVPYDPKNLSEKIREKYKLRDADGRAYQLGDLTNPNPDRPNLKYEFLGVTKVWRWTKERMQAAYESGLVVQPRPGAVPRVKRYLDELRGMPLSDVWSDLAPVNSQAGERLGYPTQKPEALVQRILRLVTDPGDLVLDCFMGGGTTAAVAAKLGRGFICGDVSPVAVRIAAERLRRDGASFDLKGMPQGEDEFRAMNGHEFAELVCELTGWRVNDRKSGDGGIDGWDGQGNPVQVKNHASSTGRPDIQRFYGALAGKKSKRGSFVAWEFSKQAMECIADLKREHGVEIQPIKCGDLLKGLLLDRNKQLELDELYSERLPSTWKGTPDEHEEALKSAEKALRRRPKKAPTSPTGSSSAA
jgi:site-specific DNA-methyltransferase (adenine-specific)